MRVRSSLVMGGFQQIQAGQQIAFLITSADLLQKK